MRLASSDQWVDNPSRIDHRCEVDPSCRCALRYVEPLTNTEVRHTAAPTFSGPPGQSQWRSSAGICEIPPAPRATQPDQPPHYRRLIVMSRQSKRTGNNPIRALQERTSPDCPMHPSAPVCLRGQAAPRGEIQSPPFCPWPCRCTGLHHRRIPCPAFARPASNRRWNTSATRIKSV